MAGMQIVYSSLSALLVSSLTSTLSQIDNLLNGLNKFQI